MRAALLIGTILLVAKVPAAAAQDATHSFKLPSGVVIQIIEAPFDAAKHHLKGCTVASDECIIDGRVPFGVDNRLPKTYVKSITASLGGKTHVLDSSQMYNAWGDRPLEVKGAIRYFGGKCRDRNNCSLRGLFSDAAGAFVAEWQVVDGISQRTVLTWSNDVVNQFVKDIDPPEFE